MPDAKVLLLCAALSAAIYVGHKTVTAVNKLDHKVCHVMTLGKKCKPHETPQAAPQR